jgi:hypothetical protein
MKLFATPEERSAAISAIATLIVGALAFCGGFISGKSDVVEISKLHISELERQRNILSENAQARELELELRHWQSDAKLIAEARNRFTELTSSFDIKEIISAWEAKRELMRLFDDIGFTKFVRDSGSKASLDNYSNLQRECSKAGFELDVYLKSSRAGLDSRELVNRLNAESSSASAYYGTIQYASLKSIKKE